MGEVIIKNVDTIKIDKQGISVSVKSNNNGFGHAFIDKEAVLKILTDTDKERLEAVLMGLGLQWDNEGNDIILKAGEGNVEGYPGFETIFKFNEDGSFKHVVIAE